MNHERLLDQCILTPSQNFSTPAAVLLDQRFSRDEKQRILESWKVDEEELSVACAENMEGEDSDKLQMVSAALAKLKGA